MHGFGGVLRDRYNLEEPGVRWEDIIKMGLQEVGWGYGLD
jgi:hypothetical protein